MSQIDLQQKFPDLRPISGPPSLFTINGCGLSIYGARDRDDETGTFVKTHCFTLLWVPILAFGAYRVAKAQGGGWYFIGRESLSSVAKAWNAILLLSIAGGVGYAAWDNHYNSPIQVATRKLEKADALADEGNVAEAARIYQSIAWGSSPRSEDGRQKLIELAGSDALAGAEVQDVLVVLENAVKTLRESDPESKVAAIVRAATSAVQRNGDKDLSGGLAVLDAVDRLADDSQDYQTVRQQVLEKMVAANPNDVNAVSQLCVTYEQAGDFEKCAQLLEPIAEQLADTEGARVLGQIWAAQGKIDEAHGLLVPYCSERLKTLHAAETRFSRVHEKAQNLVISRLERGEAPESFYERYDHADQDTQIAMVQKFVNQALAYDAEVASARNELIAAAEVVPVALDLGMVQLRRGQTASDPDLRQRELENAEQTFTSIRGVVGDSDQFRLYMGQVNYWLGKPEEGRKLFDELLASNNRSYEVLLSVGNIVREVGRSAEARKLVEEAYEVATESATKKQIAQMRAAMLVDLEDSIDWLKRANQEEPSVIANLQTALGSKAFIEGDEQSAISHLRTAIAAYRELPESVSSLNNASLAWFRLARLTGEDSDFEEGMKRMTKAVSLDPTDSILLSNAAEIIYANACERVASERIDTAALKSGPLNLISYLYRDQEEKTALVEQFRANDSFNKSIDYFRKTSLLAPKNVDAYLTLAKIYQFTNDQDALEQLWEQVESAKPEPDLTALRQYLDGTDDDETKMDFDNGTARMSRIVQDLSSGEAASRAAAVGLYIEAATQSYVYEDQSNVDELVKMAESALQESPSTGLRSEVIAARCMRACQTLAGRQPEFAEFISRSRRVISPTYLVATALSANPKLAAAMAENPDVKRCLELIDDAQVAFPGRPASWHWAMYRHVDPDKAAAIAADLAECRIDSLTRLIRSKLNPMGATQAMDSYWFSLAADQPFDAREVLQAASDAGAPLPIDP